MLQAKSVRPEIAAASRPSSKPLPPRRVSIGASLTSIAADAFSQLMFTILSARNKDEEGADRDDRDCDNDRDCIEQVRYRKVFIICCHQDLSCSENRDLALPGLKPRAARNVLTH